MIRTNLLSFVFSSVTHIRSVHSSDASVYLHHPVQAYNFVAFSRRKTFVCKKRSISHESNDAVDTNCVSSDENTLTAVTFSESHEVLNRLSSAFWPGAVTIYAPVRTRSLKSPAVCSGEGGNDPLRGHDSMASLNSVASFSSEDSEIIDDATESFPPTPVVPDSILFSAKDLHVPEDDEQKHFVGMRCPSHPIARKILAETYGRKEGNRKHRLKGAIIGMDSLPSKPSVTCKDACTNLLSTDITGMDWDMTMEKPVIHVVNGEDRHELFSVPPCQFGALPSVSLVVDAPRRNVILLRVKSHLTNDSQPADASDFDVKVEDVKRALSQSSVHTSVKGRVIGAVMSKWNVSEIEV